MVDKAIAVLSRVFPSRHIYKNLSYPDPDKPEESTAELDIAIHWEPFVVLIEAKASQFRFESQIGDIGRLRTDIKKNIEDAFMQARRAARYIQSQQTSTFTETKTGKVLQVDRSLLHRVYLATVSQHNLGSLATSLASLHSLNFFLEKEYPWALSIADLEVVTKFCEGPDIFLHYVEKRIKIQQGNPSIFGDELECFGAYLKKRLFLEEISSSSEMQARDTPNFISLIGFQAPLDEAMRPHASQETTSADVRLDIPQEIREILDELRKRQSDPQARWIAFTVLTLSNSALETVAHMFRALRRTALEPNRIRRLVQQFDDTVISLVIADSTTIAGLKTATEQRVLIEKYRRRLPRAFGFGIHFQDESRPFHYAVWADFPWVFDSVCENLLVHEPPPIPIPGTKMPKRNEPCFCGSEKKYKKCCGPKIGRA